MTGYRIKQYRWKTPIKSLLNQNGQPKMPRDLLDEELLKGFPQIISISRPNDIDGDGKVDNWSHHNLVVTGWSTHYNSYYVHDPASLYWYYVSDYFGSTQTMPNLTELNAPIVTSGLTLHHLYYKNDGFVNKGALNIIKKLIIVEPVNVFTPIKLLNIGVKCPVQLYIQDPTGKHIGVDPKTNAFVNEADAYYYDEGWSSPFDINSTVDLGKFIEFENPVDGKYLIQLTATENGYFQLFINDDDLKFEGNISKGQTLKYELEYREGSTSAQEINNYSPVAKIYSDQQLVMTGATVFLSAASSSDFDGEIVSYHWDFGDGTIISGENIEHIYTEPGNYTVTLNVIDKQGGEASDTFHLAVESLPPVNEPQPPSVTVAQKAYDGIVKPAGPFIGLASTEPGSEAYFHFVAYGVNPDGDYPSSWKWKWDFGDGTPIVETYQVSHMPIGNSRATHQYTTPGTYTVSVIFNNGIEDSPQATTTAEVLPSLIKNGGGGGPR